MIFWELLSENYRPNFKIFDRQSFQSQFDENLEIIENSAEICILL